jgi:hypothetical protein
MSFARGEEIKRNGRRKKNEKIRKATNIEQLKLGKL